MMQSTSNLKQEEERNWLDLPSDLMANILERIGIVDIIENAQKVCTAWHKVCKNPMIWRVINMNDLIQSLPTHISRVVAVKHAVDRSQGQLVDVTLVHDFGGQLVQYVADRSTQLRRLEIVSGFFLKSWMTNALVKCPLLEELSLYSKNISEKEIETVGRYCPMLKTLKVNKNIHMVRVHSTDHTMDSDAMAIAIGRNLVGLRHLELIANPVTNVALQVILDNCHHLETLDLRECLNIDLKGDLGKKCCTQIKHLKLPTDSLEGCPYYRQLTYNPSDDDYHSDDYYRSDSDYRSDTDHFYDGVCYVQDYIDISDDDY